MLWVLILYCIYYNNISTYLCRLIRWAAPDWKLNEKGEKGRFPLLLYYTLFNIPTKRRHTLCILFYYSIIGIPSITRRQSITRGHRWRRKIQNSKNQTTTIDSKTHHHLCMRSSYTHHIYISYTCNRKHARECCTKTNRTLDFVMRFF